MNLLQRFKQPEQRYTLSEYVHDVNSFYFQGLNYQGVQETYDKRPSEHPGLGFDGMVEGGYRRNGIVFACQLARLKAFSQVRFSWQQLRAGRPADLFWTPELTVFETPWQNGSTAELLARMIQDVDLAGNSFIRRTGPLADRPGLERLRPDWVLILLGSNRDLLSADLAGYGYFPDGPNGDRDPILLAPDEVAHWSPIPDPLATYRGMSWLSPIVREIRGDNATTDHKNNFFDHAATPNMVVKMDATVTPEKFERFKGAMESEHRGAVNAWKTMYLGGGADVTVVGNSFKDMDFRAIQGAGETRIASAAGVPPIVVGLSEGLDAATYCLPADELVWTIGGPKPIADVCVGDRVWSHVNGALEPRRVTWWGRTGEKQVFTIRTRNRSFRATGNHPVLVRVPGSMTEGSNAERSASVAWRTVDELKVGDCVVQVMDLPDSGGVLTPTGAAFADLMQWLGAYVGDGSGAGHPRGCISMALPPADRTRDYYEKLTTSVFPTVVHIGHEPRSFRFNSVMVSRWLAEIGFAGRATTKTLPPWLFTLRRDLRLAFLAGLVDTDGSVDRRGTLKIQLANRHLIEQVKMLAVSCGMQVSNLYEQTYAADVLPNPGKQETYVSWAITISSATDVAQIPFNDWWYRERVEANVGRQRRAGKDAEKAGLNADQLGFFCVRSIEPGPVVPVFDITVDEGASFVAGGVVVHNSNYAQARRAFADLTVHPLWGSACDALSSIIPAPARSRLWYDAGHVPFLKEDQKDAVQIQQAMATTIAMYVREGFTAESAVAAVVAQDPRLLEHTGALSVQLVTPGAAKVPTNGNTPALTP